MSDSFKIFAKYSALTAILLAVLLVFGCSGKKSPKVTMGPPMKMGASSNYDGSYGPQNRDGTVTVNPVVSGQGEVIAVLDDEGNVIEENGGEPIQAARLEGYRVSGGVMDGQIIRSGDFAMQAGLMAQSLPTENWFSEMIPTLFGVDPTEAKTTLMMYGQQLQAWALRQVILKVNPTTIIHTLLDGSSLKIITGGFEFKFHPDTVPPLPAMMSGLQRLGITGREILGGLLAYFVFDLAKTNSNNSAATNQAALNSGSGDFEAGASTFEAGASFGQQAAQ